MGHQRNTIPHEEYVKRMEALMPRLLKTRKGETKEDILELFLLYNDRLTPRETKEYCGGCRSRVFKRMEKYYSELLQIQVDQK